MAPDWEAFGKSVMAKWPEGDVDGFDLQRIAERFGIIVLIPGGFDPDKHIDMYGGAEPGDPWFERNY